MEKLKKLIEQYKYWSKLSVFIERIEMNLAVDFSISMENTKSLLEAVGKEICKYPGKEIHCSGHSKKCLLCYGIF